MSVRKDGVSKEDLKSFKEEIVQQFHIVSEGIISQVKQVAEGVVNLNEKLDRTRQELREEIKNDKEFLELKLRVQKIENRSIS